MTTPTEWQPRETDVPARSTNESPTTVRLNAPGQRGLMQSLVGIKKSTIELLPVYAKTLKQSRASLKKIRSQNNRRQVLKSSLIEAQKYVTKLTLAKSDEQRHKCLDHLKRRLDQAARAEQESNTTESIDNVTNELRHNITQVHDLAHKLEEELKRTDTLMEGWMDVKWTAENATAVGRGPPGNIAFNNFTQYDPPYETKDVIRVIEEASKRTR